MMARSPRGHPNSHPHLPQAPRDSPGSWVPGAHSSAQSWCLLLLPHSCLKHPDLPASWAPEFLGVGTEGC